MAYGNRRIQPKINMKQKIRLNREIEKKHSEKKKDVVINPFLNQNKIKDRFMK